MAEPLVPTDIERLASAEYREVVQAETRQSAPDPEGPRALETPDP